jgi:hypothetical protein
LKIAFFLPQYHSDPVNDHFWGRNFTEWVNVKKAKPLFRGHVQPKIPSVGYYALDEPQTLMERLRYYDSIGIGAIAVYTYWFSENSQALAVPLRLLEAEKSLPVQYFISWVNADWTKSWVGNDSEVIARQSYDGTQAMYQSWRASFEHPNYLKIDGRHAIYIHNPEAPGFDFLDFVTELTALMKADGYSRPFIISPSYHCKGEERNGVDKIIGYPPGDVPFFSPLVSLLNFIQTRLLKNKFIKIIPYTIYFILWSISELVKTFFKKNYIPTFLTGWDNTPRYSNRGYVISDPMVPMRIQSSLLALLERRAGYVFVKAANEWAEGNTIEGEVNGNRYTEIIRNAK